MSDTTRVNNIHECEMSMVEETTQSLERLDDKVVAELCRDYAHYTRVNISEEHGQVVTQIAAIEEQIQFYSTGSVIRTCRSIHTEFSQLFHNGIIMFLYSFESYVHVV